MIYSDRHVHTSFSGDSDASALSQIEKAIELGMECICFTDHHDYDVVSDIDFTLDIPAYLEEMGRLKNEYEGRIEISAGIELGLQPHLADYLNNLVKTFSFDFIIGSVHFIEGLDPYYPEYFREFSNDAYRKYFEVMLENIEKIKCYDSLGHLDYIVRYGKNHGLTYSYSEYFDYIDLILQRIIVDCKSLECNTGGYAAGLGGPNPCRDILVRYRQLGGELITIGSDAHSPDRLGADFESCGELLKECGFRYYAVYRNRRPKMLKL